MANPPGTPPYEGAPPDARMGFDPEGGGEFLQRTGIPREGSGFVPDRMATVPYQRPLLGRYGPNSVPDIDAAIAAGNATSAVADPSAATPQQSTITAAVDPTKPAPQQGMGGGMKFSAKPANYGGQRMTAQDFVPHPDPYTIVDDGHSFSRAAFNLPAPAIAARLQGLAKENEELNKLTGDVFKQDTKEVVPAQYSRSYNALWDRGEKEYRASILAQYGGRQDLAAKAIAGKDSNNPEAHRGYLRFNRDMDEIGRIITHDVAEAEKNVEEMLTNKRVFNQESFDASQELINAANSRGSEGLGDIQALMKAGSDYKRAVTLPYFLGQKDKDGKSIDDTVKMFMYHTFPRNADGTPRFEVQKNGMNKFMFHEDQVTADKMIDNLAEELYPQFRMEYPTKEAFRTALQNHYPTSSEIKVDDSYKPNTSSSGSSGSSGAAQEGKVWFGQIEAGPSATHPENQATDSFVPGSPQSSQDNLNVDRLPLGNVIGGRNENMTPKKFTTAKGESITMQPQYIEQDPLTGDFFVTGKLVGQETLETELVGLKALTSMGDLSSSKKKEANARIKEITKKLADTRVPLDENDGAMNGYLNGGLQDALSRFPQRNQRRESKPFVEPTKASTVNGASRKDGAVYNAKLGGWYKKVGNDYVLAQ